MSGRSNLRRVVTPSQGHPNPFGARPPASDPHHTTTMADAVRRCRWIAIDINASGFVLLFIGPPEEKRRLIHGFDAEFPTQSALSRLIATCLADDIACRISVSTLPLWWSSKPATASHDSLLALEWCDGPITGPQDMSGIVFPVHAERGQSGVVIFTGDDMTIDNGMLFETHARCFALFDAVTRLRPTEGSSTPAISKRELECLTLTANGLTSEEIAAELGLSVHTANQYLTNTAQKLNAVNRMHAVAKALRLGLIE